jgi:hypothetical protein
MGTTITSAASAVQSVTPALASWWIMDPTDATSKFSLRQAPDRKWTQPEQGATFYPEGRQYAVVITDNVVTGREGKFMFICHTKAEHDQLVALVNRQKVLLIQTLTNEQIYFRPTSPRSFEQPSLDVDFPNVYRWIEVPFVEQARP